MTTCATPNKSCNTRSNIFKSVAAVLVLALIAASGAITYLSRLQAEVQTAQQGEHISTMTAVLVKPLLIGDDRISLNYLLNELLKHPQVTGLELKNQDQLVARAGEQRGIQQQKMLTSESGRRLGELSIWLNPEYQQQHHQQLLLPAAALAVAVILATLLTIHLPGRRRALSKPQTDAVLTKAEIPPAAAAPQEPELDINLNISKDPGEKAPDSKETESPLVASPPKTPLDTNHTTVPSETDQAAVQAISPQVSNTDENPFVATRDDDDSLDTDGLISLLKPENQQRMPHFTPTASEPAEEQTAPAETSFGIVEETPNRPDNPPRLNPLMRGAKEVQLDLYSLEQELELIKAPHEAGYLLLIDMNSGLSDNLEPELQLELRKHYLLLAQKSAEIYSGNLEQLASGDIKVSFQPSGETDGSDKHGINALCAAQLFVLAYQQFNQQHIRRFEPVLNLHMALVRGDHSKPQLLMEEALFLSRTTQSNSLISHTALTEATELKESLLLGAEIRREDEDKVLILSITSAYQKLLMKQAHHLLTRL